MSLVHVSTPMFLLPCLYSHVSTPMSLVCRLYSHVSTPMSLVCRQDVVPPPEVAPLSLKSLSSLFQVSCLSSHAPFTRVSHLSRLAPKCGAPPSCCSSFSLVSHSSLACLSSAASLSGLSLICRIFLSCLSCVVWSTGVRVVV